MFAAHAGARTPVRATVAAAAAVAAEVRSTTRVASRWLVGFGPETIRLPQPTPGTTATGPRGLVLLVHGIGSNKSHFSPLEKRLLAAGYAVSSLNYPWAGASLSEAGQHVAADAEFAMTVTGIGSVHVIGHSLGGVVARWALGGTDLGAHARSLTTLGAPHAGTPLARLTPSRVPLVGNLVAQLRVRSADLAQLPHPADLPHVQHLAIAGRYDLVVPAPFATLPEAQNVTNELIGSGHNAMPSAPVVGARVLDLLATADPPRAA